MNSEKTPTLRIPRFRQVKTGDNELLIHGKAFQRMLALTRLFGSYEVGTYLLSAHPTMTTEIPPVSSAFIYWGQDLSGGHIQEIPDRNGIDCAENNDRDLALLRQNFIGRHHSHGLNDAYQSGID